MRKFKQLLFIAVLGAGTMANAQVYKASYVGSDGAFHKPIMVDDGTLGDVTAGDGIFSIKVSTNVAHNAAQTWYVEKDDAIYRQTYYVKTVKEEQDFLFTFDTNTYTDGWLPATDIADSDDDLTLYGSIKFKWQSVGGTYEAPIEMADGDGDNIYTYELTVPTAGSYSWYAFPRNNHWKLGIAANGKIEAYGGLTPWKIDAVFTTTQDNQKVTIMVNIDNGRVKSEVDNGLSIEGLENSGISIYPNPSTGIFNLNFTSSYKGLVSLNIFSLDGRQVQSLNVQKNSSKLLHSISLANQPKGIYLVKITEGDKQFQQRIVKK